MLEMKDGLQEWKNVPSLLSIDESSGLTTGVAWRLLNQFLAEPCFFCRPTTGKPIFSSGSGQTLRYPNSILARHN
jgi:hypothetical protein